MKRNTWNFLYNIRHNLTNLYVEDKNKTTRKEIDRLIKSLTRILDKQLK